MKKTFHIGDALSITSGRIVSKSGINGVYNIMNFILNTSISSSGLSTYAEPCKLWLLANHVELNHPLLQYAEKDLINQIQRAKNDVERDDILDRWLNRLVDGQYGFNIPEYIEVIQK